jgi:hypothetical protein
MPLKITANSTIEVETRDIMSRESSDDREVNVISELSYI